MLKIIIDTNVLVSSLIQKSYPFLIIDAVFLDKQIQLCISNDVFEEYSDVLNRKKFFKYPDFISNAKNLLANIQEHATKYYPANKLSILSDQSDNKFFELADICAAEYLITGNTNDFKIKEYKQTRIVSPKEFCELELHNNGWFQ